MPNGILVVDLEYKEVVLANREMESLVSNIKGPTLKEKLFYFIFSKAVIEV